MEEEKKEVQEPNTADDKTSNNEEATESKDEDVAKKIASLEAQKEHFREKYNKVKESLSNVSFDDEEKSDEEVKKEEKPNISDNDRLDILDFSIQHKDLEREDVLKISKYAKSLGISMEQALKDEFIQAGIEKKSKEKASQDASIDSTRSPRSNNRKEIKYKPGMSREEFKELWKKATQN